MLEARCGGWSPSHARSLELDCGEGAAQWSEGCGCTMRGDLSLRRTCSSEDEVYEVSPQAYEH